MYIYIYIYIYRVHSDVMVRGSGGQFALSDDLMVVAAAVIETRLGAQKVGATIARSPGSCGRASGYLGPGGDRVPPGLTRCSLYTYT